MALRRAQHGFWALAAATIVAIFGGRWRDKKNKGLLGGFGVHLLLNELLKLLKNINHCEVQS